MVPRPSARGTIVLSGYIWANRTTMALKAQAGRLTPISRPSNPGRDPRYKKAEEHMIKVSDQLIALYSTLKDLPGTSAMLSRISDMDTTIHNLRGMLWDMGNRQ